MVHQIEGKLLQVFKHPSAVYGCDWNPNNENIIATACEDGLIRIFYVGSGTDQPLKVLSGHEGKAFRVKWSPLKDGILCSTSDDCSVRVWHYARGIAVRILEGHTNYTRGLLWCPELPNVVISGSWDSTIRVWDISDGACLDVIEDHGADVYGLACHAERPFVLASTSRDSTVRLWSVLPLVSTVYLRIILSRPVQEIFSPSAGQPTEEFEETLGLYGSQSKVVKDFITKNHDHCNPDMWRAVSSLFCPPSGITNLWELVSVIKGQNIDFGSYKTGIVHKKHVMKLTKAKALETELANVSFFGSGVNTCGKSENIHNAADYHLLTGNLRKYCELKILLGEWLEAISVAPGVSLNYWRELCNRWLTVLKEENSSLIAPVCIATNKADELIKYYMKQNFMEKAYIVSVAACESLMPTPQVTDNNESIVTHADNHYYKQLINENLKHMSERYMLCETPVKAACWYLSDDKIQDAVYCLLRGNELELAVSLCLSLGIKNSSLKMAVTYLSWRCIQKGDWDLAVDILNLCPGTEIEKMRICVNCSLSMAERADLYKKAGLFSVEDYKNLAEDSLTKNIPIVKVVLYFLLSNDPKKGLDIGLKCVKDALTKSDWKLESVWQVLTAMSSVSSHLLQDISFDRQRFELQVYCTYVGAFIAIRQGFYPIVVPLFSTTLNLMRRVHNANLSITEDLVSSEMHAWVASKAANANYAAGEQGIYKDMLLKALENEPFGDIGVTIVSGSSLPRHSDHHRCYLRGSTIKGPVYFLDDSKSAISLNDALMWAKVNRFSPLKTGMTINPF